jgi:hypothetical protein
MKRTVAKIGLGVGRLYLMAFMVGTVILGGDAINGHAANGHYYLDGKGHLTEVSRTIFLYSKWHSITSFLIAAPLAIGCAWYLLATRTKKISN